MKKLLVLATGEAEPDHGGSGFKNLVLKQRSGELSADIVAVVSNHEGGGVFTKARELGIPFIHFPKPWTRERYQEIVAETKAGYVALSGWLKPVRGLDPRTTFNIHPALLPQIGGKGIFGIHAHEEAIRQYNAGLINHTAICMHFVTDYDDALAGGYDRGPVFFRFKINIIPGESAPELQQRVLKLEHIHQPRITDLVVNGKISWNGENFASLKVPWMSIDHGKIGYQ